MERLFKEIQVVVEGKQPNYFELIPILVESQQMTAKKFGNLAMAVYRLPNKYHEGGDGTA